MLSTHILAPSYYSSDELEATLNDSEEYSAFGASQEYFSDSGSFEDAEEQGNFHELVNSSLHGETVLAECGNFSLRYGNN